VKFQSRRAAAKPPRKEKGKMRAIMYEINAYEKGYSETGDFRKAQCIPCGRGKKGKDKAVKRANEMWHTGKYEAVFVDAHNDEEIVDNECVNIPTT
jgi:hypothetical protein